MLSGFYIQLLVTISGTGGSVKLVCTSECPLLSFMQEVAASLLGRFLSRHCFTLCITVEVEPRIAKQHKCHHCCSCKNYWGKGMEDGKKCLMSFSGWPEDRKFMGHRIAQATSYCLLPDTFWLWASKNIFKVGRVKIANSLSPPSIVKKVCAGSKSSQGT